MEGGGWRDREAREANVTLKSLEIDVVRIVEIALRPTSLGESVLQTHGNHT